MKKGEKKQVQVFGLIVGLVAVLFGGVLFMGAVSGWFDDVKVVLDEEYYCTECDGELMELANAEYEELVNRNATFVVFVDQGGCTTADNLRGFVKEWAKENGVKVYRMMFSDMKETSLHEAVKFYPSVAIVSKGKPVVWLRADVDEDAAVYNNYADFVNWITEHLAAR